ncbi:hypothetical protein AMEX_G6130 [Astyanax mexicanus]|uniref:Uncharacterized protein n=1 Tax=Astyanax mexicanus TaxID=7994 RepID=A0A8T2M9K8_ASTMX|nr:hypothetical protein AMEX_G6130 [Astyanax mexicanus]
MAPQTVLQTGRMRGSKSTVGPLSVAEFPHSLFSFNTLAGTEAAEPQVPEDTSADPVLSSPATSGVDNALLGTEGLGQRRSRSHWFCWSHWWRTSGGQSMVGLETRKQCNCGVNLSSSLLNRVKPFFIPPASSGVASKASGY